MWGEELFIDATKVEANASIDSRRSRSLVEGQLEEHLAGVFPEDAPPAHDNEHSGVIAGVVGPEGDERQALAQTNAPQHRWIEKNGRKEREMVRWGYERMADLRVSTTDPDASAMHQKKKGASKLGYQIHYVVDGGKARVILDVLVTPAEVTENLPMRELLFRSIFRWRLSPRSVTGDATYGRRENIAAIEKAGIFAYTALADQERRTALFTIDAFVYDAQRRISTPVLLAKPCGVGAMTIGVELREVRCQSFRLQRVSPQEQVHEESKGTMGEPQPRGRVPR